MAEGARDAPFSLVSFFGNLGGTRDGMARRDPAGRSHKGCEVPLVSGALVAFLFVFVGLAVQ